jgi:hypothetical protein
VLLAEETLGTIANNLAKNPNMSPARRNAYRTAADKYISGIDPTKQGYNAVTKKGGYGYDDAYINYAPPSGGDSRWRRVSRFWKRF